MTKRRTGRMFLPLCLLLAFTAFAPGAEARKRVIEEKESLYNSITIAALGDYVIMQFGKNADLYTESVSHRSDPLELPVPYTRLMTVGMAYPKKVEKVVEIGVGGGSIISYLSRTYPNLSIDAVEIDPAVLDYAAKYFHLKKSDKLRLHSQDGRIYMLRSGGGYDLALIDAYRGPFVPFHLLTEEFYKLVAERLAPGGAMLQNVAPDTMLYDSAVATIAKVFETVEIYEAGGNCVILAHQGPPLSDEELAARAAALDKARAPRYRLSLMIQGRRGATLKTGQVLRDDFAPVEALKATERFNRPDLYGPGPSVQIKDEAMQCSGR